MTSLLTLDFALDLALDCALDGGRHGRQTTDRDEPSGDIISVASPGTAPPLVPLRSEYERRNDRHPAIWHRHDPLTRRHRAHRRPRARCGPPPARPAARIAGYAHYASSGRPASPSGCAGRRTGHASHPLTDGRNHRGDTISGPRARGLGGAGGRCRRYGVPVGSSMGRPRPCGLPSR